jgi:hypothetical protein
VHYGFLIKGFANVWFFEEYHQYIWISCDSLGMCMRTRAHSTSSGSFGKVFCSLQYKSTEEKKNHASKFLSWLLDIQKNVSFPGIRNRFFFLITWVFYMWEIAVYIENILTNGLACQILVSVCLLVSNLSVHTKPDKCRSSRHAFGILIEILNVILRVECVSMLPWQNSVFF